MIKTKHCQHCGKEMASNAAPCAHCGRAFAARPKVDVLDQVAAVRSALSDKYEIVAEIGQGGNATVYQAIQKNLDRKVALKVLLPGLVSDQGYNERFHLEARAIAKLRHPNIVTIYDEGTEQGIHFIAMEFLEGKDLHHLVKEKGSLEIREAVVMAKCIASALDYAHSYNIVHRDVKSSNIIMTSTRTAVLTDFGIAQSGAGEEHSKSGSLLGTPEFMSPEQAGGKPLGPATDFYSLGVVLYHTLSGQYPFQGESPITTIHKILYEKPVPLGRLVDLPPELELAIERCLARDPAERVQDGKELIAFLNRVRSDRTARTPKKESGKTAPESGKIPPRTSPQSGKVTVEQASPKTSEMPIPGRANGKRRGLVRAALVAMVVTLVLTGYVAWDRLPGAYAVTRIEHAPPAPLPERRLVPYLIGATKEEAIKLLNREGLELGNISVVAIPDSAKRGKVDSQRPTHGAVAKPGSTVDLLIGE